MDSLIKFYLVGASQRDTGIDTESARHYSCGMKNVTIAVDEKVARWARVWAAEHDTSLSRIVGDLLRERMDAERGYGAAMRRALAREPALLKEPGERYPTRESLHDR